MTPDSLNQFIQLFTLTDTAATQRVSERLALVLADPAAYQTQFAEELEERGICFAGAERIRRYVCRGTYRGRRP